MDKIIAISRFMMLIFIVRVHCIVAHHTPHMHTCKVTKYWVDQFDGFSVMKSMIANINFHIYAKALYVARTHIKCRICVWLFVWCAVAKCITQTANTRIYLLFKPPTHTIWWCSSLSVNKWHSMVFSLVHTCSTQLICVFLCLCANWFFFFI